jgi:ubiquinone/menaquinone biosynthesis C-methylase UbiE
MPLPPVPGRRPDASVALGQYRRRADHYDIELAAFEPVRREALGLLQVRSGGTVLDVGCGTGLSFEGLKKRVGAQGRIVGIDPSPEMLAHARERIARNNFDRIELLQATAVDAPLRGRADAALFHFTHDILQDAASVDNVIRHLRPGAHVVASGLQWAPAWFLPVNLFVLGAALYSVTCLEGLEQPWKLLGSRLKDVQVRTLPGGAIYIASGTV